jgi:hypothetical protein
MTFPVTDRFTTSMLVNWLKPQIQSGARVFAGREPDTGRTIVISRQQGIGFSYEGIYEIAVFQVRCRGGENNYQDTEQIAVEIDNILLSSPTGFDIGDVHVVGIGHTGGSPQILPYPDIESRYIATCNYFAEVSTGL